MCTASFGHADAAVVDDVVVADVVVVVAAAVAADIMEYVGCGGCEV